MEFPNLTEVRVFLETLDRTLVMLGVLALGERNWLFRATGFSLGPISSWDRMQAIQHVYNHISYNVSLNLMDSHTSVHASVINGTGRPDVAVLSSNPCTTAAGVSAISKFMKRAPRRRPHDTGGNKIFLIVVTIAGCQ